MTVVEVALSKLNTVSIFTLFTKATQLTKAIEIVHSVVATLDSSS